mmetsp:Transcript_21576/g.25515  ORF Transcript_21576/g.25515 Transcript_21576/m.25515 type:complete len:90 (-) Transcript_21576:1528-1797(-)
MFARRSTLHILKRFPPQHVQQAKSRVFSSSSSPSPSQMLNNILPNISNQTYLKIFGAGAGIYLIKNSVLMTDAGYIYVCQNNLTGTLDM